MFASNGYRAPAQVGDGTKFNGRDAEVKTKFRILRNECRLRMLNDKALSHAAYRLGCFILEHADYKNPEPFPGAERLAKQMGVTPRYINTLTKELVTRGHFVVVEVGGQVKDRNSVWRMATGGSCARRRPRQSGRADAHTGPGSRSCLRRTVDRAESEAARSSSARD